MIKNILQYIIYKLWRFMSQQHLHYQYKCNQKNGTLTVGKHTYGTPIIDSYKGSEQKVTIGSYCSIAKNVVMVTGGIHPLDWVSTYPFRAKWGMPGAFKDGMPSSHGDIVIGSDVWIGTDVMILSGVNIGHGVIIAARSVVTRDIPSYAIAAGVPAKIIKYRFDQKTIDKLLSIQWWEWDENKIMSAVPLLSSRDVHSFTDLYIDIS